MKSQVSPAVIVIIIIVVLAVVAVIGWRVLGGKPKPTQKDGKGPGPGEFMKPGTETGGALGPGTKGTPTAPMSPGAPGGQAGPGTGAEAAGGAK